MWIFLEGGRFLSIAADLERPGHLLVRARLPGDIETDFPEAKIGEEEEGDDYRFHASLPREQVIRAVAAELEALDYPGLREGICNRNRKEAAARCAEAMREAQDRARAGLDDVSLCRR